MKWRRQVVPIAAVLLAIALVVTGAFSFVAISSTNRDLSNTKSALASAQSALASEQAAHKAATDQVAALDKCVTALKADEAAMTSLNAKLGATEARLMAQGDFDAARTAYEAKLAKGMADFDKSWIDLLDSKTQAQFNAAVAEAAAAEAEMNAAKDLKTQMDTLGAAIASQASDDATVEGSLTTQVSETGTVCAAAAH